jgi:hypothetical protein
MDVLSTGEAERIVESLRKGIPPAGHVRQFTVGRKHELADLEATLGLATEKRGAARLIRANYGSGKSHLLRVIREMALEAGYATALVTMDAEGGVRGNRMDQVFGAVSRSVEVPGTRERGICSLFDLFLNAKSDDESASIRDRISDGATWGLSEYLRSPAMFIALRAWATSANPDRQALIADWLGFPNNYEQSHKRDLYYELVAFPGRTFRDPRPEREFYDGVFQFRSHAYGQSWGALRDLDEIAKAAGLRGLVLLIDEFEDVIQNLNNRDWQQSAFANLFRFFRGEAFPGMAYFAVTPEFSHKCKRELLSRGVYDFPTTMFDALDHFEMSQISAKDLRELSRSIRDVHSLAYDVGPSRQLDNKALDRVIAQLVRRSSQDQTRQVIEGIVAELDDSLD